MIKNYITVALRNLLNQKFYSIIKILGLSVGLASSILIALFVYEDFSYDGFNTKKDRIVRVLTIDNAEGVKSKLVGITYPGFAPAIEQEVPEVENSVRIFNQGRVPLRVGDNLLSSEGAYRTESSFFEIFDYKLLNGDPKSILDEPNSVVLTQALATKLFGKENPVGKAIQMGATSLNVKAVMANPPKNSHLQFDMLRSITPTPSDSSYAQFLSSFSGISAHSYLLLDQPRDLKTIIPKLKQVADKNQGYELFEPSLQYLSDVHLKSGEILFEQNHNKTDGSNLYVLSFVALLIILLAAVNFMNLVTAHAASRAKEVGLRKVVGAVKGQLIWQHLLESMVVTAISFGIAFVLALVLLPVLNNVYQRYATYAPLLSPVAIIGSLIGVLILGLLAGSYPAFVLSSFKPVTVLKGAFKNTSGGIRLRQTLVVLQFTISIALMVGMGIVFLQMHYIQNKDLGFSRDQVLAIPFKGPQAQQRAKTLQTELKRNPNIISTGTSSNKLGQQLGRTNIFPEGKPPEVNYITSIMVIDESFIPTMDIKVLKGRNFSTQFPADSASSMIINEEMARLLDWSDPVGKTIRLETGPQTYASYQVVGLVKDFHFATVRHKVEPVFMLYNRDNSQLAIKISTANVSGTLDFIEQTWKRINTETPYEYNFLDADFANLYRSEQTFATMFSHFTVLALFIAVLGLLGLSAFTAQQRRKEISIRKVLGADVSQIIFLLSKDFLRLVLVAVVIAIPVAWYFMRKWLEDFAYRTDMNPWIFIGAALTAIVVALVTVSYLSYKAAQANPIKSLRNE